MKITQPNKNTFYFDSGLLPTKATYYKKTDMNESSNIEMKVDPNDQKFLAFTKPSHGLEFSEAARENKTREALKKRQQSQQNRNVSNGNKKVRTPGVGGGLRI